MRSEWRKYRLGDLCSKIGSGATPRGGGESYKEFGISLIRSQNVLDFQFSYNGLAFIDENQAYELRNVTVQEGDILLNITGDSVARVCKVPVKVLPARVNQHVAIIRGKLAKLNSVFLLYYLQNIKEYLLSISEIGATRRAITKGMIECLEISIPNVKEQTSIASILSSLDDKIDLLHRQNATLEKMAETLFRQWFVEETKEEWEVGVVNDFAIHAKESIQPQKNKETLFYHYSIPAFDNNKNPIKEFGKEIQSGKYRVPVNCILFSKLNPHKDKRVWILEDEVLDNSICSTEFQIVKPKEDWMLYFLYGWLTYFENYNEIASGVGGTSGSHQRIDPSTIFSFQCLKVSKNDLYQYNSKVQPLFKKISRNRTQIDTLISLRDTLLPKLMSGELIVVV